jgi:hypothetical protein
VASHEHNLLPFSTPQSYALTFWYFWLAIQNTGNWHVSNAFDLLSVFISFSAAFQTLKKNIRAARNLKAATSWR